MKRFFAKSVNIFAVAVLLMGYNMVLQARHQQEEIERLEAELKSGELSHSDGSGKETGAYADGTWEGQADGFGGIIKVSVLVEDGNIKEIKILSADGEDGAYLKMAQEITGDIIEEQSTDVDVVSGATFSSNGIKNAVKQALDKAVS